MVENKISDMFIDLATLYPVHMSSNQEVALKMLCNNDEELVKEYMKQQENYRKCFYNYCNAVLHFNSFVATNVRKLGIERCIELWSNDKIQFYCCECYKIYASDMRLFNKLKKV